MNDMTNAFNEIAKKYDSQRMSLIPCYNEFYNVLMDLAGTGNSVEKILDIGAGTGLMTEFLLKKYPQSQYTLIDISGEMLNIAKNRFKNISNIIYICADYLEYMFSGQYDVVISALSIHHLEHEEKRKLFAKINSLLSKGGVFINGDQFLARSINNENFCREHWKAKITNTGLTSEEKQSAYERMKFDKPATIEDNFLWLEEAGFSDIHLFYKYFNFGIIRGKK